MACAKWPGYGGERMKLVHMGLLVSDLARAARFYEQVLGLCRIPRPALDFAGIWYGLDEGQALHLMRLENPYAHCALPAHGGRDRHMALQVEDLAAVRQRLEQAGIPYTLSRSGRTALFCRDPDGNAIELMQA